MSRFAYGSDQWVDDLRSHRPMSVGLMGLLKDCQVVAPGIGTCYRPDWRWEPFRVGGFMEATAELLAAINQEVAESKRVLEQLANEVSAVYAVVKPALIKQAAELRSARMATVTEVRESLSALADVRRFFLDKDYDVEVARLERFVRVCRDIQALKREGVFDAVCESAIRLAVMEGTSRVEG